ncbi:MAG: pectin acetylesterase-family hydrolase [Candidatus Binatia bacterium]
MRMTPRLRLHTCRVLLVLGITTVLGAGAARATAYPVNQCVSTKQRAAGGYCRAALRAWATWETKQNAATRAAALGKAAAKLDALWAAAETASAAEGSDCADATLASTAARGLVDSAVGALVADVNAGLDLGIKSEAGCGARLLRAAAIKCGNLLLAESAFVKVLANDPHATQRDQRRAKASAAFTKAWAKGTARHCPTTATVVDAESRVDAISADIVTNTTVSPHVDDTQFTTITPTGPIAYAGRTLNPVCMNGSPYAYFVKRGSVNKLLIYYQGGGACWENLTCSVPVCDTNVNPTSGDNPNNQHDGFADVTNPLNPFRDWNIVFVSYCSCDIHFGESAQDYAGSFPTIHVEHRGYENARVVEKWTREHFVNPERIFVTGSSAGAYGAWFNAPLHETVWPASHFDVLADAGNGVITQSFLDNEFPNWNFAANLPTDIPGLRETLTDGSGIPGYTQIVAGAFPETRWAHYSTAFDGGTGGQTGFYNVMRNPTNTGEWFNWWHASCDFDAAMVQQTHDTAAAAPSNYRYYIGSGSRHTMWGSNKVYTDTTGGVPTVVDWIDGMLAGSVAWSNVQCTNCGLLLPGDPRPSPLQAPFALVGSDVVVQCPSSASGAFVDAAPTD